MATQKLASAAYLTLASAPFVAFGRLGGCGENWCVFEDTKTEWHQVSVRHNPLWTTIRVQRRHVLEKWQTVETFRYFRYTNVSHHVYPKADALDLALEQQATLHKTEMLKLSGFKKKNSS